MRTLIFLIVISAFLIWFGVNFRHSKGKIATPALIIGGILAVFTLLGFLRLI